MIEPYRLHVGDNSPTLKSVRRTRNLRAALREVNRTPVGLDGIPWQAYVNPFACRAQIPNLVDACLDLEPLESIQASILYGCNPDAVVPIQTKNRVVECGTTANRIRERAIARKLDAYLDPNFDDASYAFRPGRSPETAILCVRDTIRKGAHWALKTDIAHFFDSVDRRILDHLLAQVLRDRDLRCAIMVAISPVIVSGGTSLYRQKGLPQGNGIAPILSNLYLHLLDESCSRFQYFRYADDILVLAATREEVEEALNHIRRVTTLLRLQLSEEKNQIRDLYREPVKFLGYEVRGGNIYVPKESVAKFVQN